MARTEGRIPWIKGAAAGGAALAALSLAACTASGSRPAGPEGSTTSSSASALPGLNSPTGEPTHQAAGPVAPTPSASAPEVVRPFFVPTTANTVSEKLRADGTPISYKEVNTKAMITNPAQFAKEKVCFPAGASYAVAAVPEDNKGDVLQTNTQLTPDGPRLQGLYMQLNPEAPNGTVDPTHMLPAFIPNGPLPYVPNAAQYTAAELLSPNSKFTLCGSLVAESKKSTLGASLRTRRDPSGLIFKASGVVVPIVISSAPSNSQPSSVAA